MSSYEDFDSIDQIRALMKEGMKSALVRDASGRPEFLYEAHFEAEIGEKCLRTQYKYQDGALGTSKKIIAYEEIIVAWPGYEILSVGAGNDINNLP